MAKITLRVEGSTVGSMETIAEISSIDSNRLMSFLVATYGLDEDGEPQTPQKIIEDYWQGVINGTLNNVLRYEKKEREKIDNENIIKINIMGR